MTSISTVQQVKKEYLQDVANMNSSYTYQIRAPACPRRNRKWKCIVSNFYVGLHFRFLLCFTPAGVISQLFLLLCCSLIGLSPAASRGSDISIVPPAVLFLAYPLLLSPLKPCPSPCPNSIHPPRRGQRSDGHPLTLSDNWLASGTCLLN